MPTDSHTSKTKNIKKNFTADLIETYQCNGGKSQTIYWDAKTPSLGLRVTAKGAKSYIFETSLDNKTIRMTIGDVRTHTIKAAQTEATKLKSMTDQGIDPRQVKSDYLEATASKKLAKEAETVALILQNKIESATVGMVWQEYVTERKEKLSKGEPVWSERHYNDHIKLIHAGGEQRKRSHKLTTAAPLASLANIRLIDLTTDVVDEWATKEATVRPTQARLALRLLRAFLFWCGRHKVYGAFITSNPAQSKDAIESLGTANAKNDVLQKEQLPSWFSAVKQIKNPVISAYLQTLLLVGRRPEQVAAIRWVDVDFKWNSITMNDKTEGVTVIPLTPYVSNLLSALPHRNEFVFSSLTAKAGYLADPNIEHHKACAIAGLYMTLHGLRRSFASLCEWVEMPEGIAAQIQGHAPQGVREKNYIRRPLDLLRMWHVKIEAWILEQAEIDFKPVKAGLSLVATL